MEVTIDTSIIEGLSANGILAYIAVKLADGKEATTPALAGLVRCSTGNMLAGVKELSVAVPEMVARARNPKTGKLNNHWVCGIIKAGDGVVLQNLESERFRVFVDVLKKYWDALNPTVPFSMGAREGMAIRRFLSERRDWNMDLLIGIMRNRFVSVRDYGAASRSEPIWSWVEKLDMYLAGPMDRFGKPVEGLGNGKAAIREQSNRQGNEEYVANRM